ncbi:hypothetical protein Tco_0915171 [Tanacetum coccineum]
MVSYHMLLLNNNSTQDENVRQCSYNDPMNECNVPINTNDPNNVSPSLSGPTSYANLVENQNKRADVAVPLESIRAISERFENTDYGFFLGKRWLIPLSSYARAMIELSSDVELKDIIMVAMPKLVGEGFYMCTIRVEYMWTKPRPCVIRALTRKPLYKAVTKGNEDSESEVEAVFDVTANLMASTSLKGGSDSTNCLLEQWRGTNG